MGLAAIGTALASIGRSAISFLSPAATTAGRVLSNPLVQGGIGGAAGSLFFGGGASPQPVIPQPFSGGGMGGSNLAAMQAAGAQITELANGQFMAVAPNGDMQIFNRAGNARRPTAIIPAGQAVPGGSTVVATRNNGSQIGVVKKRRRKRFAAELNRTKNMIKASREILNLCAPKPRKK